MKIQSLFPAVRGALAIARDPRFLARVPKLLDNEARQRDLEARVRAAFGGPPRTVPVELLLPPVPSPLPFVAFLDDSSPVVDLALLRGLMSRFPDGRYLEVGTLRGESALAVAALASQVVTISLPDDELERLGADPSFVATHRVFSSGEPKIRHLLGDSRSIDLAEFEKWADVVFIDGDHRFEGVASDTRRFWRTRRGDDSIVVWHDAFSSPLTPRWEVLAGIAEGLPPNRLSEVVHVSNTLCVAWLPAAHELPTVSRSYVPRLAFTVGLEVRDDWAGPGQERLGARELHETES